MIKTIFQNDGSKSSLDKFKEFRGRYPDTNALLEDRGLK